MSGRRLPEWFKVKLPSPGAYARVRDGITRAGTHTVCESANCPNIGECWGSHTATVMLLGDKCTRSCRYCNVKTGKPGPVDKAEPEHVAELIRELGIRFAVITSVTRDDLPDGGAAVFAETVRAVHALEGNVQVELLTPDYGKAELETVLAAEPEVFGHNIETVERIFPQVKSKGAYHRSLNTLKWAKEINPAQRTKSGLMAGLGETMLEIEDAMVQLRQQNVGFISIGQYLQPSSRHASVHRFYTPEEFKSLRDKGLALGFAHVESGPLVRSSYHAERAMGHSPSSEK